MLLFSAIITLCSWTFLVEASPITIPLTPEGEIDNVIPPYFGSRKLPKEYHKLSPNQSYAVLELDVDLHDSCGLDFNHQWTVHTGSAIYSTPVIFPASEASDMKNIFVASYFNYIEVIQGDGYRPTGWPIAFEDSTFQASPLVFDIDNDGNTDIGVVDRDANLFWIRTGEFGTYLEDYHVQVPKLRILRDWYETVKDNFKGSYVMISMFDRYQAPFGYQRTPSPSMSPALRKNGTAKHAKLDPLTSLYLDVLRKSKGKKEEKAKESEPVMPPSGNGRRRLLEEMEDGVEQSGQHEPFDIDMSDMHLDEGNNNNGEQTEEEGGEEEEAGPNIPFYAYGEHNNLGEDGGEDAGEENMIPGESIYGGSGRRHVRGSTDDGISYYMSRRQFQDNEQDLNDKFVNVDPHVLATPAMGDINGDGHMEIIFPVSYYFDAQDYLTVSLPEGIDGDNYVASGLVCWDMQAQEWSWTVHLDLTTAKSKFQGLMYASPTIADLDGDKRMEVIVGTSMGMLYIVDGESGFVRHNFPLQFHSIQAQVAVADLLGGFELEMIVCDMGGSVIVLNVHGDVLWDRQLSGSLPYAASVGDVDGDGQLDVVVVTVQESTITRKKARKTNMMYTTGGSSGSSSNNNKNKRSPVTKKLNKRKNSKKSSGSTKNDKKEEEDEQDEQEESTTDTNGNSNSSSSNDQEEPEEMETVRRVRSHIWALRGDTGAIIPGFPIALPQEESISGPILLLHDYAALTRYIEAQSLQQEEMTLVNMLKKFQQKTASAFFANSNNSSSDGKEQDEKSERGRRAREERERLQAMQDAHNIAQASDHLYELKENSISSGHLQGDIAENDGVYMLVSGFQGHLYVIALAYDPILRKQDFCVQMMDIGSPMVASPLLEDVTGDGYLDLVISTLPGEVMVYETNMPRHAGNIWDSFPRHHRRSFSTGDLMVSIPEKERSRLARFESRGDRTVKLEFDIFDHRCSVSSPHHKNQQKNGLGLHPDCGNQALRSYHVRITRGKSNEVQDPLWQQVYHTPGHYTATLELVGPDTMILLISVTTEHGLYSEDTLNLAISTHFYVWLKYFTILPVLVLCLISYLRLPTMGIVFFRQQMAKRQQQAQLRAGQPSSR